MEAGHVVGIDALLDDLWGEPPPAAVLNSLHGTVAKVRRACGRDAITTSPAGYRLVLVDGDLDLDRFAAALAASRAAGGGGDRRARCSDAIDAGLARGGGRPWPTSPSMTGRGPLPPGSRS